MIVSSIHSCSEFLQLFLIAHNDELVRLDVERSGTSLVCSGCTVSNEGVSKDFLQDAVFNRLSIKSAYTVPLFRDFLQLFVRVAHG